MDAIVRQVRQPNKLAESAFGGSADGVAVAKMEFIVTRLRLLPEEDIERLATVYLRQERGNDTEKMIERLTFRIQYCN